MEVNVPLQLQLSFPLPPFHGDHEDLMFGAEPFGHLEDPPLNPSFDIWIGAVVDESWCIQLREDPLHVLDKHG